MRLPLVAIDEFGPRSESPLWAVAKRVHHPLTNRNENTSFSAQQNGFRKRIGQGFRHVELGGSVGGAQERRELREQSEIHEWSSDFEGVCHARPVGISQELIAHIAGTLEKRNLGAQRECADSVEFFLLKLGIREDFKSGGSQIVIHHIG